MAVVKRAALSKVNYYQVGIHVHVSCRKVKGRCQIANCGYCVAPFIVNFFAGPLDFTIMRVDCTYTGAMHSWFPCYPLLWLLVLGSLVSNFLWFSGSLLPGSLVICFHVFTLPRFLGSLD